MTEDTGSGTIQISENVIAAVVRRYSLSVPGVARLAGQSFVGGLADMFGKRINDKSIVVEVADERVNLTVHIIIKFGEHVPTVATHVQDICLKYVEELTGQNVGRIDVVSARGTGTKFTLKLPAVRRGAPSSTVRNETDARQIQTPPIGVTEPHHACN